MQTDVITKRVVLWFFFLYQPQFCLSAPPRSLSCRHVGDKPSDLLHPGCGRILLKDHDLSCTNTTRRSQEAGDNRLRLIWDVRVLSEPEITKGFSCSPSFLWIKQKHTVWKGTFRLTLKLYKWDSGTQQEKDILSFFFSVVCVYWHGVIVMVVDTGDDLGKCCGGPDVQITSVVKLFNFSFP